MYVFLLLNNTISDLATTKPVIPEAVKKCDGGVANKIKKNLTSDKHVTPDKPLDPDEKRKLKRFSQRRKTDEIIPPTKETSVSSEIYCII